MDGINRTITIQNVSKQKWRELHSQHFDLEKKILAHKLNEE